MKPKVLHKEAMNSSYQAKNALEEGDYERAFRLYTEAALLESQVAEFYFDKPELEPTRSVVIRSAAYLNLKAGQTEKAKQFICFGLLNTKDALIKEQLNDALELAVSFGKMPTDVANREYNYLNLLRQRSVHYVIEPATLAFGHSVSLEMIKDFTIDYLKSLKAYAVSRFKSIIGTEKENESLFIKQVESLINPLVTGSAYGSFKFSIANDFLSREDEQKEILELKSNVVAKYHNDIFINPLTENDIAIIKDNYSDEEVNEIFRPLSKIKSINSPYKVGYYDTEDFNKKFVNRIVNKQRQQLLTVKTVTQDDIGELENSITHKRNSLGGKVHKTTIFKEQMKSAEWNFPTNQIEPSDSPPIIFSEEILLDINFNSNIGFTISYSDFRIEHTDIEYHLALKGFYNAFFKKLKHLAINVDKNVEEQKDWERIKILIGNTDALK